MVKITDYDSLIDNLKSWIQGKFGELDLTKAVVPLSFNPSDIAMAKLVMDTIGKDNVLGVITEQDNSIQVYENVGKKLDPGRYHVISDIDYLDHTMWTSLSMDFKGRCKMTEEIHQEVRSRIKAMILHSIANLENAVLFNSTNMSDIYLGNFVDTCADTNMVTPFGNLTDTEILEILHQLELEDFTGGNHFVEEARDKKIKKLGPTIKYYEVDLMIRGRVPEVPEGHAIAIANAFKKMDRKRRVMYMDTFVPQFNFIENKG